MYGPGQYQWDIALFKNVAVKGPQSFQFRAEIFNFLNHANLNNPSTDPTSATFGRVTGKDNSRRDIQLSLRVPVLSRTGVFITPNAQLPIHFPSCAKCQASGCGC